MSPGASQTPSPEPADQAPNLVGGTIASIRGFIQQNGLKPGQQLPGENALADAFGVSRPVVREAMRALAVLGVIEISNGRRARVGLPDPDVLGTVVDHAVHVDHVSIQQIYDVRRTIERRTVALAALRRSAAEADEIRGLAAAMRRSLPDAGAVMEADVAFHLAIAGASRNPMFELLVRSFVPVTRKTWPIGWASRTGDGARLESIACHEAIAAAIGAGDPVAAEAAMDDHFDRSVRALLAAGLH